MVRIEGEPFRLVRPALADEPELAHLQVFDVDFDTSKPLLRWLGVQMQTILIVYHGSKETGRMTGPPIRRWTKQLLETFAR